LLVAGTPVRDLLLYAKHLFVAAKTVWHGVQVIARRPRPCRSKELPLALDRLDV